MLKLGAVIRRATNRMGFDIVRARPGFVLPADADPLDRQTLDAVKPYTMTSPERVLALCEAARYVAKSRIPGAIVECGVWRGGSMMAVARTLRAAGDVSRQLYLFDTFEGMSSPTERDVAITGDTAKALLSTGQKAADDPVSVWCYAPLEGVRAAIQTTGYPLDNVHFVVGKVEDTIPREAPAQIALLRLDTDWYESTRHEMEHLFPRLSTGGVLIIDDYGHWKGASEAVDEYLRRNQVPLFLQRIDYTGRLAVKTG